jgi:hypothetical protein
MKLWILQFLLICRQQSVQLLNAAKMNGLLKTTLMKALIKNPKTKRMIEAGNFLMLSNKLLKCLNAATTPTTKRRNRLSRWLFHSLKQETGESGAEFVDHINAAAMKLEKAGEVVSDAAKLTRLIHPNQGSGSMYDKLGMTIYTTPDITFDKASGLFEGMEHSGLAPVPPAKSSAQYVNAIFCNYCRKNGHKTKICRAKKSARRKQ